MTTSPIDRVLSALKYMGPRDRNQYLCLCPAHSDSNPSLSVGVDADGKVLVKCYAGCSAQQVVAAAGLTMSDLFPAREQGRPGGRQGNRVAAEYSYRNTHGKLLYQVVRYESKRFAQRRPDGKGGWIWNVQGVPLVLYMLPELVASDLDSWVFVVEGEKDVDNLHKCELIATTNVRGAGKWSNEYNQFFEGRKVCVLPDNDMVGRQHAYQVACALYGIAACVRVVDLPDLQEKGDVSDWLANGGDVAALLRLVEHTPDFAPRSDDHDETFRDTDNPLGKTSVQPQPDALYDLAKKCCEIFTGPDGTAYASVPSNGHVECHKLGSKFFSGWLTAAYRSEHGKLPSRQAREAAIDLLRWEARCDQRSVCLRVGNVDCKTYIDLGSADHSALEVDTEGWRIVARPSLAFRRSTSIKEMPIPREGGSIALLKKYINVEPHDFPLVAAWVVAALNGVGPYPVLVLTGEPGTAKSTTLRVLKELIDPSAAGLRGQPREIRDVMIGANNTWLLAFDNVSFISQEVSDALCRIATGGGYAKRANYSDDEEFLMDVQRPVVINGIGDIVTHPDLLERSILLRPPVICESQRRPESEFWRDFSQDRSPLLGALLHALSVAKKNLPNVHLAKLPRMADFARFAVAAEEALESSISILDSYDANRHVAYATVVETSIIGETLLEFLRLVPKWEGTATDLLIKLTRCATDIAVLARGWPKQPNSLSKQLQRLAPSLRQLGFQVEFRRASDPNGTRLIRISRLT